MGAGPGQRRVPLVVERIHLGTGIQQHGKDGRLATQGRVVQRGATAGVAYVDGGTIGQQGKNEFRAAVVDVPGGQLQGRQTAAAVIGVNPGGDLGTQRATVVQCRSNGQDIALGV